MCVSLLFVQECGLPWPASNQATGIVNNRQMATSLFIVEDEEVAQQKRSTPAAVERE